MTKPPYTKCLAPVEISESFDKGFWRYHRPSKTPKNARFWKPQACSMVRGKKLSQSPFLVAFKVLPVEVPPVNP